MRKNLGSIVMENNYNTRTREYYKYINKYMNKI